MREITIKVQALKMPLNSNPWDEFCTAVCSHFSLKPELSCCCRQEWAFGGLLQTQHEFRMV